MTSDLHSPQPSLLPFDPANIINITMSTVHKPCLAPQHQNQPLKPLPPISDTCGCNRHEGTIFLTTRPSAATRSNEPSRSVAQ